MTTKAKETRTKEDLLVEAKRNCDSAVAKLDELRELLDANDINAGTRVDYIACIVAEAALAVHRAHELLRREVKPNPKPEPHGARRTGGKDI